MTPKSKYWILIAMMLAGMTALLTWKIGNTYVVAGYWETESATYKYHASLPTGFQSPTNYGAQVWTRVLTSAWSWEYNSSSSNQVSYEYIDGDGGTIAETTRTTSGGYIIDADIKYDSSENWYTGTGTPGGNQIDARSIAAHEFGHGLGLSHTQSAYCPGGSSDATMCSGYVRETIYKRTLETDDKDGVSAIYPAK